MAPSLRPGEADVPEGAARSAESSFGFMSATHFSYSRTILGSSATKYVVQGHPTLSHALPMADVPGQELDGVLVRVAEHFAYFVEDAGSLCLPGLGVCAAFFADIFES